jgi:hypothetical protein
MGVSVGDLPDDRQHVEEEHMTDWRDIVPEAVVRDLAAGRVDWTQLREWYGLSDMSPVLDALDELGLRLPTRPRLGPGTRDGWPELATIQQRGDVSLAIRVSGHGVQIVELHAGEYGLHDPVQAITVPSSALQRLFEELRIDRSGPRACDDRRTTRTVH